MYCYAQACRTMKEEDWINAHIAMYEFFGGVTRILTPDNLKVGILSNRKYEDPVINRAYQELADHYQTALLPARVLAPRDKAAVEGSVGNLTSHIIARLRNRKFFDIHRQSVRSWIGLTIPRFRKKMVPVIPYFWKRNVPFCSRFLNIHMNSPSGNPLPFR